jgi:hypothetical protein
LEASGRPGIDGVALPQLAHPSFKRAAMPLRKRCQSRRLGLSAAGNGIPFNCFPVRSKLYEIL